MNDDEDDSLARLVDAIADSTEDSSESTNDAPDWQVETEDGSIVELDRDASDLDSAL